MERVILCENCQRVKYKVAKNIWLLSLQNVFCSAKRDDLTWVIFSVKIFLDDPKSTSLPKISARAVKPPNSIFSFFLILRWSHCVVQAGLGQPAVGLLACVWLHTDWEASLPPPLLWLPLLPKHRWSCTSIFPAPSQPNLILYFAHDSHTFLEFQEQLFVPKSSSMFFFSVIKTNGKTSYIGLGI